MEAMMGRDQIWSGIGGPWDVLVVGGGVVGAGILREAARLGMKTLLVEAHDYSSGTSSRSSKMVHGGLRYLATGQIKLTMQSVRERQRLLREGQGLVDPLEFLLVSYKDDRPPAWVYGLGLMIYDTLAMHWNHEHHTLREVVDFCPDLSQRNLAGGYRFFDAQTDDARLVLRVIREAQKAGGVALNYARVEGLLRDAHGKVCGAVVHDLPGDRTCEVQAKVVINATGAWADELRGQVGRPRRLRQLRGSHLVFSQEKLPVSKVISFMHPADKRPVFAFPWEGVTLVGTTDVDHHEPMETNPQISRDEVDYLMQGVQHLFGCLGLTEDDVISTIAGIRSVLDTGKANPSKESRDEVLWDEDGLVTITGGKLTMFRHMAQTTLRFVHPRLKEHPLPNPLARALDRVDERTSTDMVWETDLDPAEKLRLLGRYGTDAPSLLETSRVEDLEHVCQTPTLWAELGWAAKAEQVVHLEDLLLRRTRLGLLLPDGGLEDLPRIRELCQPALGWTDEQWSVEEQAYQNTWRQAYAPPHQLIKGSVGGAS
ncbi:MAG TPA: glycerol-3-phosphate dehydrogenase/oxidase [Anaerolineaceae bacterium]|nr:glycerol-3-phosphate dehydrogenase/oxidase [Anaerolineaceae bacterium]HOU42877.1 glycerol-3-phosphate dehydrogenase/oxidase [Anaerolineaceae bacterium]HPA33603.1 glycerol-3-phosphate dehydrogenase/oxidase [Anaerolineaceae bacterium]HQF44833.1 glycerol-3-phosphate dehydrogenase/oxidase [Anaerolineaceae bacterium]HQH34600.1 glycerol-3-phosphate dehydrogenase/oxidase [Anaerolineaceae bacterium]